MTAPLLRSVHSYGSAPVPLPPETAAKVVRVLVAYPNTLFREAIVELLRADSGVEVAAVSADHSGLAELAQTHGADVLLLGFDDQSTKPAHIKHLASYLAAWPLVVFAGVSRVGFVEDLIKISASAYIINSLKRYELLFALHSAVANPDRSVFLAPSAFLAELGALCTAQLTEREHEVLRLVAKGFSNRQVGAQLFLAEGTVKRHLHSIYRKLDARSRTDAVRRALSQGLLTLPEIDP